MAWPWCSGMADGTSYGTPQWRTSSQPLIFYSLRSPCMAGRPRQLLPGNIPHILQSGKHNYSFRLILRPGDLSTHKVYVFWRTWRTARFSFWRLQKVDRFVPTSICSLFFCNENMLAFRCTLPFETGVEVCWPAPDLFSFWGISKCCTLIVENRKSISNINSDFFHISDNYDMRRKPGLCAVRNLSVVADLWRDRLAIQIRKWNIVSSYLIGHMFREYNIEN